MWQTLPLTNDTVHEAYYEENEGIDKIKYQGVKVWPRQGEDVDISQCLQFMSDEHCSINLKIRSYDRHIYYMVGADGDWDEYTASEENIEFGGDLGNLYIYGDIYYGVCPKVQSESTVPFKVQGPLSALSYWEEQPDDGVGWDQGIYYYNMFEDVTNLVDASGLQFWDKCNYPDMYNAMFKGCSRLITGPNDLELAWIYPRDFKEMFMNCESLIKGPNITCYYGQEDAFYSMYENCTSLVDAPWVKTTGNFIAEGMGRMFYGCVALKNVTYLEHPGAYAYYSLFENCVSLEEIPEFMDQSASIGLFACCRMFANCTNLKSFPHFEFRGHANGVWKETFLNCISLDIEPHLRLGLGYSFTYQRMFVGCLSLTSVILENGMDDPMYNDHSALAGCFSGCSNLNNIVVYTKALNDSVINDCFEGWIANISPTGIFKTRYPYFPVVGIDGYGAGTYVPREWTIVVLG